MLASEVLLSIAVVSAFVQSYIVISEDGKSEPFSFSLSSAAGHPENFPLVVVKGCTQLGRATTRAGYISPHSEREVNLDSLLHRRSIGPQSLA